jgi:hypothetical protein
MAVIPAIEELDFTFAGIVDPRSRGTAARAASSQTPIYT